MPLPQQVIDRLGQEAPAATPGWSFGILLFSGGVFCLVLLIYFGLSIGYTDYLNNQLSSQTAQSAKLAKAISPTDQQNLINFYSESANVNSLLASHVYGTQFFSWLEKNTQANVYFTNFSLSLGDAGDKVTFTAIAATEADLIQQLDIFQLSPQVESMSVSGMSLAGTAGEWECTLTLTMQSSTVLQSS